MDHPLIVRRDIEFLLYDWLGLEGLLARLPSGHSRETVDAVLDLSERLAVDHFLPHYKDSDRNEPRLDADGVHILPAIGEALAHYAELGLFAASFSPELGGLGLPFTVTSASFAYFAAANIATAGYSMLTVANARLIATFGTAAQIDTFARPQIRGEWFGTMCLSEPQAGSDLGMVKTRALREDKDEDELGPRYRLVGNKMWISGGEQDVSENIVHLVLAKVPLADGRLPEGTAGLSLFIVPRILPDGARNDVVVAGLNHKMGYRGTSNCLLNFGEREGAVGWLVGAEGDGLRQMFLMMNEARINVGLGAAALGYRGYRHALKYAQERAQGRAAGAGGRNGVLIIEHADVKRMLLAQKAYAEGALALCLYCARLVDEDDDADSSALLALLTPVAKTWSSEYGLAANDLAIQIHGGYGYTRDFDVEQIYRDNRLNPIHEGTTGIQAIDLLGRKILRDAKALGVLRQRMEASLAGARHSGQLSKFVDQLERCWAEIAEAITSVGALPAERRLDNATFFLSAFGHAVVAWLWLDQAVAVLRILPESGDENRQFLNGKLAACRFFFDHELGKTAALLKSFTDAWDWSKLEAGSL